MSTPLVQSNLPFPCRRGKVRDVYDLGDSLLIVSSDRISAFDWILPTPIPDKGRILTQMSLFWFDNLGIENHLLSSDIPEQVKPYDVDGSLAGRVMVVRKAKVVPFECVVRGYLEGSGWRDYQETQSVCGIALPAGLKQCEKLPTVLFTPATKAEVGHDENIDFQIMLRDLGNETANALRAKSLEIYAKGSQIANDRGIIIADTKFEFGWFEDRLILIDEVLTPDSSRFWPMEHYQPGRAQPSYDKQFVREFLLGTTWDRNSPPPELPAEIVEKTRGKYVEAYERLSGTKFE
jgi:phosphoribosylaminoimidazole-succinocarboxamide synthase